MSRLQTVVLISVLASTTAPLPPPVPPQAPTSQAPQRILITNVSIFDGTSETLITGRDVVVVGDTIESIVAAGTAGDDHDQVVDGGGGFLTPGLIDAHWHSLIAFQPDELMSSPAQYLDAIATWESEKLLMRGVTTIRDAGGNSVGLMQAINEGYVDGPRIYPSQALISQYSGHADFRDPNFLPKAWGGPIDAMEQTGIGILANGVDQILRAARNNLYQGATQIKIATSGGVVSEHDPLDVYEFFPEEIEAAVRAAADYGTYVMAHVHSAGPIKRSIRAGVKSIEHASQADEEAIRMIAENDLFLTVQPLSAMQLAQFLPQGSVEQQKAAEAVQQNGQVMEWARQYDVTMGWGTDLIGNMEGRDQQLHDLTVRKQWYSSAEIMIQATGNNGRIVAASGSRNPYGRLGVVEEGALADLLVYSHNPLEDVAVVEDHEANLKLVMKGGKVFKNTLR